MSTPVYQPFVLFQQSHLIVLALTVIVPVLLAIAVRGMNVPRLGRAICWVFALAITLDWALWYVVFAQKGWLEWGNALPMDLCSWAAIATVVALVWRKQKAYELAYFWALAGTLQGLLRPGIPYDFPEFRFIEFTIFHAGIIAAVLFMTLALKMRPYPASIRRVIIWSLIYMAAAAVTDWIFKVDYGFLRSKPIYPSLFDLMPDWPWYLPVLVVLGVISALIFYAPFFVADLFRRKKVDS